MRDAITYLLCATGQSSLHAQAVCQT